MSGLRIAVIVPSYRRPRDLARCLEALGLQTRPADQLLVVARTGDEPTWQLLAAAPALRLESVPVSEAGVVAALNAGLARVAADVVAFTDDDAAPRPDWLERIAAHFSADSQLGGLGGRDWIFHHGHWENGARPVVGKVYWFGRCVGNHHLGVGEPREVDVLKGVNMAFRTAALGAVRFDTRLRGSGAQVGNELGVALAVKRRGWKLIYDPSVAVEHYPATRHDEDQRNSFSIDAVRNAVFNETLLLCGHFGSARRWVFMLWALAVGSRAAPGLLHWLRWLFRDAALGTARLRAAVAGRLSGFMAAR